MTFKIEEFVFSAVLDVFFGIIMYIGVPIFRALSFCLLPFVFIASVFYIGLMNLVKPGRLDDFFFIMHGDYYINDQGQRVEFIDQ